MPSLVVYFRFLVLFVPFRRRFLLFFRFLLGAEFLEGGASFFLPGERDVFGRVVRLEGGNGDVEFLEKFDGLGEFVTVDVGLAVAPGPLVRG